jgi:hypothetical protein
LYSFILTAESHRSRTAQGDDRKDCSDGKSPRE